MCHGGHIALFGWYCMYCPITHIAREDMCYEHIGSMSGCSMMAVHYPTCSESLRADECGIFTR